MAFSGRKVGDVESFGDWVLHLLKRFERLCVFLAGVALAFCLLCVAHWIPFAFVQEVSHVALSEYDPRSFHRQATTSRGLGQSFCLLSGLLCLFHE